MPTNYHFRLHAPQKGSRTLSSAYLTPPLVSRYGFFSVARPLESGATPEFFPPVHERISTSSPSLFSRPLPPFPPLLSLCSPHEPPFSVPSSSAPSDDLLSPVFRLSFVVTDGWHGDVTVDAVPTRRRRRRRWRRDAWNPVSAAGISRVPAARLIFRRRQDRNSRWILSSRDEIPSPVEENSSFCYRWGRRERLGDLSDRWMYLETLLSSCSCFSFLAELLERWIGRGK